MEITKDVNIRSIPTEFKKHPLDRDANLARCSSELHHGQLNR